VVVDHLNGMGYYLLNGPFFQEKYSRFPPSEVEASDKSSAAQLMPMHRSAGLALLQPRHSLPPTTLRARNPASEPINLLTRKQLPKSPFVSVVETTSSHGLSTSFPHLIFGTSLQLRKKRICLFASGFQGRFGDRFGVLLFGVFEGCEEGADDVDCEVGWFEWLSGDGRREGGEVGSDGG
jgi:hypothetical protein